MLPTPRLRRLSQLYFGLALYGFSDGLLLLGGLGVDPWDVLHQGLSREVGLAVGTWSIIVGACVLVLWIFPAHWDPKLRIPRGQVVAAASIVSPKY